MNVLMIEPRKRPHLCDLPNDLKSMQAAVGGLIQMISPFENPDVTLVCNDEGKLLGLPLNRGLSHPETGELYEIIAGTFFLSGHSEGDLISLTDEQIAQYTKLFYTPEWFIKVNGKIQSLPMLDI